MGSNSGSHADDLFHPFFHENGTLLSVHFFQGNALMIEVQFQKQHGSTAFTFQRVITKRGEYSSAPLVKTSVYVMLFMGYGGSGAQ